MRKLASIKTIAELQPIEGKDRIVLASVDGWRVIVKKGEFRVGDLCVYVEIDSVLPEKPEFEFLRSKNFRVKTMKMGKVFSQGICFPLSILPLGEYHVNQDVTELLGVKQYEATMDVEPAQTEKKGASKPVPWYKRFFRRKDCWCTDTKFPSFISKTDETRIQNMPWILDDKRQEWVSTEKVDGSSMSAALVRHRRKIPFLKDEFEFIVCSRNYRRPQPDNSAYWKVAKKYEIERKLGYLLSKMGWDWVAVQGEVIGPRIQKNKYARSDYEFYVFNLLVPGHRFSSEAARGICQTVGLEFVPILDTEVALPDSVAEVLGYAHGQSALNPDVLREGIVFRSKDGSKSFKAVDPLFLIQYDE